MKIISLCFYLVALTANAADWSLGGGPGIVDSRPSGAAKVFAVRRESGRSLRTAAELGAFVDNAGSGHHSSLLAKLQLGTAPGPEVGLFGKAFIGVCGLSHTDTLLGGHLQFCEDIGVGVRDAETFMLVGYSHISSAGLSSPNRGRDFIVFSVGVRL